MTDLTKLTAPFGLLDEVYGPGTQEALETWPHGWEFYTYNGWKEVSSPFWVKIYNYRAKPAPLTKPSVDWSLCPEWANWLARDEDGKAFVYEREPEKGKWAWCYSGLYFTRIDQFPFYDPGDCDWSDSLVERSEAEKCGTGTESGPFGYIFTAPDYTWWKLAMDDDQ